MESIKITPGFCPNCGSILPHLRPSGKVKCYNCLTDWPPEGECEEKKDWSRCGVSSHSLVLCFQCLAKWKPNSRSHSTHTRSARHKRQKKKTKDRLSSEFAQSVATIKCPMPRCSCVVPMKGKLCSIRAQTASEFKRQTNFAHLPFDQTPNLITNALLILSQIQGDRKLVEKVLFGWTSPDDTSYSAFLRNT